MSKYFFTLISVGVLLSVTLVSAASPEYIRLSYSSSSAAETSMAVTWNDDKTGEGKVYYGVDKDKLENEAAALAITGPIEQIGYQFEAFLEGLTPGTLYFYRVESNGASSETYSFRTGPADECTPFTFVAVGDTRSNDGTTEEGVSEHWKGILDEALMHNPDFVLNNGDLIKDGESALQWKNYLAATEKYAFVPVMPSLGNHDVDGDHEAGETAFYNRLFALPKNDAEGGGTEDFYYFTYGNVIFVVLNTNTFDNGDDHSLQANWADKIFTEHPKTWKFLVMHYPIYQSGDGLGIHPGSEKGQNDEFLPVIDKHHVDVVLTSHNHLYERFRPLVSQHEDGEFMEGKEVDSYAEGSLFLVSGGGGAGTLFFFDRWEEESSRAGSEVRSGAHHYLAFNISSDKLIMSVFTTKNGYKQGVEYPEELLDHIVIEKPQEQLVGKAAECGSSELFDKDGDGWFSNVDCDDTKANENPLATGNVCENSFSGEEPDGDDDDADAGDTDDAGGDIIEDDSSGCSCRVF